MNIEGIAGLIFLFLILGLIYYCLLSLKRESESMSDACNDIFVTPDIMEEYHEEDPENILKMRLANGEISPEEYTKCMARL